MKKIWIYIIFTILTLGVLVIANLYNNGVLSKQWAYIGGGLAWLGIILGTYGFIIETIPKFKSIYKRLFKKEETKTEISKNNKYRKKRGKYII